LYPFEKGKSGGLDGQGNRKKPRNYGKIGGNVVPEIKGGKIVFGGWGIKGETLECQ